MKFKADMAECENGRDKILSVWQIGPDGSLQHQVIIQRGPKEYDARDDAPGPKISCEELGLDLAPGPKRILIGRGVMTIVLSEEEKIEVDISGLPKNEQHDLKVVAEELLK